MVRRCDAALSLCYAKVTYAYKIHAPLSYRIYTGNQEETHNFAEMTLNMGKKRRKQGAFEFVKICIECNIRKKHHPVGWYAEQRPARQDLICASAKGSDNNRSRCDCACSDVGWISICIVEGLCSEIITAIMAIIDFSTVGEPTF